MNLHTANNKFWETINNFVAPDGGGGGGSVTVDASLSSTSENPVQNKAIYAAIQNIGTVTVDDSLSSTSENPVQNKVIYAAIQDINTALSGVDTLIGSGVIE